MAVHFRLHVAQFAVIVLQLLPHQRRVAGYPDHKDGLLGKGAQQAVQLAGPVGLTGQLGGYRPQLGHLPQQVRVVAYDAQPRDEGFQLARDEPVGEDGQVGEAEIAGKLSHPAIVSIYDVGEDYDLTYLAMEFLEGEDLRVHTHKDGLLPLKRVLSIIQEVATGLDYAHNAGVIHRDVKPANIMILKNGQVKVTDFGIAKAVSSSQTKSGVVLGTPNYMSPEQISGQTIDGRSDIFSLGIVFFELLTGQLPFQGTNLTNLLYQITHAKHPSVKEINPKIPKPCEQLIDKALNKDPRNRFQRSGDLAKYIRIILDKMEQLRSN